MTWSDHLYVCLGMMFFALFVYLMLEVLDINK